MLFGLESECQIRICFTFSKVFHIFEELYLDTIVQTRVSLQPKEGVNITFDANGVNGNRKNSICPEVEDALRTLDKVISIARQHGFNSQTNSSNEEIANLE